jgi:uncharacterized surface protein with fasciclin (FAS1) repeats
VVKKKNKVIRTEIDSTAVAVDTVVAETPNIVGVAAANAISTLVTAIEAAGLVETLSGDGPFTVLHQITMHLQNLAGTVEIAY